MIIPMQCFAPMRALKIVFARSNSKKCGAAALAVLLSLVVLPRPSQASAPSGTSPSPSATQGTGAGSLDASFGSDGTVSTAFSLPTIGDSIAAGSNGKLVVGGFSISSSVTGQTTVSASQVARYNADGSLDSGFGKGGLVSLPQSPGFAIFATATQTDGKVLLGGAVLSTISAATARPELVRLNTNGSVDTTFGAFGTVLNGSGVIFSIALQPNGQIVTAGLVNAGSGLTFGVTRYNSNGSLDANFGAGGEATVALPIATSVALQSDGKIVAGGAAGLLTNNIITGFPVVLSGGQFAVVRFNADGSLDTSFGNAGFAQTALLNNAAASQVAVQPDGKVLAAGSAGASSGPFDFAVVRYNSDGSLDSSFGTNGAAVTNLDGSSDLAYGMALQADGQIVVAGTSLGSTGQPNTSDLFLLPLNGTSGNSIVVARFNSNGSLDTSFGSGGFVVTSLGSGAGAFSVVIPEDGKIAVAGATATGPGASGFAIAQYDAGTLSGDFAIVPSSLSASTAEGSSTTLTISAQDVTGSTPPSGAVNLSASVLPAGSGVTADFSPTSIATGQSSTLTIGTSDSTLTGSYSILITATAGSITHSVTLNLSVTGEDFSISLAAPTITTPTGANFFPRVVINQLGGFDAKVTVTAPKTGLPTGVVLKSKIKKTRRKNLVAQFEYKATDSAVPGTYFITFMATDATGRIRMTTLTLIIQAPSSSSAGAGR